MQKKLLFTVIGILFFSFAKSQVEDVSVIVSPTAGYNWFDNKSTVENGLMYGIQAGFGFGRVVELRGIYERSANLKQAFGKYEDDIQNVIPGFKFQNRNVSVTRYGGEFKTNIPARGFAPYLVLGTGVQKFEREITDDETYKTENLYGTGGLGLKINMGERTTLNLEGRGITYNMDPTSLLYNPGGSSEFDDWINNQKPGRMFNWSVQAALQFYLGGRTESEQNAIDRAYRDRYSGGLSQLKFTLSPAAGYINFNDKSGFRNTYLMGGILGLDFTNFIGLRGYYYQATNDEKFAFDFDKLAMYGVDFVGNLNVARGIVPYITIGGGYLNVQDDYTGRNLGTPGVPVYQEVNSGYYAKGGVGLTVPLGQYVDAFGAANLFYTMDDKDVDVADLKSADQLNQHTMYNAGLRLKLGARAKTERELDRAYDARFSAERSAYERRIRNLEKELQEAIDSNDTEKVMKLMQEKKELTTKRQAPADTLIKLTPAELESIIEKTVREMEGKQDPDFNQRIDSLQKLLKNIERNRGVSQLQVEQRRDGDLAIQQQTGSVRDTIVLRADEDNLLNRRLIEELNNIKRELRNQNTEIQTLRSQTTRSGQAQAQVPSTVEQQPEQPVTVVPQNQDIPVVQKVTVKPERSAGVFVGANFGDATTFNIGGRLLQNIANSRFQFMPEAYFAFGKTMGFGVSANVIYPIAINNPDFLPYAGLGLGLNSIGDQFNLNPNIIVGTFYRMGAGNLFADYTVRGGFKNNQIAVGYNFKI